jgi:hypothetical protein
MLNVLNKQNSMLGGVKLQRKTVSFHWENLINNFYFILLLFCIAFGFIFVRNMQIQCLFDNHIEFTCFEPKISETKQ